MTGESLIGAPEFQHRRSADGIEAAFTDNKTFAKVVGLLFIAGLFLVSIRNPTAIINPSMFTEDGAWSAMMYSVGVRATYIGARPDYLVIGNIALLHLATLINGAVFGLSNIDHLPEVIAGVSITFFAAVAVLPVVVLRNYLPGWALISLWLFLILMPMGFALNEIIGRLSNVGYAFAFMAVLLSLWRMSFQSEFSWRVVLIDVGLLLCAATNPIVLGILTILFIVDFRKIPNNLLLGLGFACLAFVIVSGPNFNRVAPAHTWDGWIAAGLTRPLLFPFTFPFYEKMPQVARIVLTVSILASFVCGWYFSAQRKGLGFLLACLALVTAAVAVMRPELEIYLPAGYAGRYFYAQNALAITAFVWIASEQFRYPVPVVLFGFLYVSSPGLIFEMTHSSFPVREDSFANQLRRATPASPGYVNVLIHPGWTIKYPERFKGG